MTTATDATNSAANTIRQHLRAMGPVSEVSLCRWIVEQVQGIDSIATAAQYMQRLCDDPRIRWYSEDGVGYYVLADQDPR